MPPELSSSRIRGWQYVGVILLMALAAVLAVLALRTPAVSPAASSPLPTLSATEIRPTAIFLGDASVAGAGASTPEARWSAVVSSAIGWQEVNQARPGTAYGFTVGPDGCDGADECRSYSEAIPQAVSNAPGVVVVGGGVGDPDSDPLEVTATVKSVYEAVRIGLPDARVIAVGPWSGERATSDATLALDAAVRSAADSVGATYVSLITPPVLDTATMVTRDGTQLNDAGHAAIAARVLAALGRNG
jgi:hypothetical protein